MNKLLILTIFVCFSLISKAQTDLPAIKIKNAAGRESVFNSLFSSTSDTAFVVSFWATWCIPCINELETINDQFKDKQKEINFKVITISVDDARTASKVKPLVKGKGWAFDVYQDVNNDLKRALNINDVPHILIIKKGKIVYQHTGYMPGNEEELYQKLKSL